MGMFGGARLVFSFLFCILTLFSEAVFSAKYLVRLHRDGALLGRQSFDRQSFRMKGFRTEVERELRSLQKIDVFENTETVVVESEDEVELQAFLQQNPAVEHFEKEIRWKTFATPSELPSSQDQAPWLKDILGLGDDVPSAEESYVGSEPLLVAVIDTGLNVQHPYIQSALATNSRESSAQPGRDADGNGYANDVYGANVYERNGNVSETGSDHGSHVAGLVKVVRDQALRLHPEARRVQVMPIKFIDASGFGSTAGAVAALEYAAARGARVVNASWGAVGAQAYSQALFSAMSSLYQQNIFIAVAAGNAEASGANNNDVVPVYPASFSIPGLLSVASLTPFYTAQGGQKLLSSFSLSDFSNYGANSVEIAAPGDYRDPLGDYGVLSIDADYGGNFGEPYKKMRGTSMATPVVSGVAAVVRAINPDLTAYEVKRVLLDSAKRSSSLGRIKGSSYLHAQSAFALARSRSSEGLQPSVPESSGPAVSTFQKKGGAGCGLIDKKSSFMDGNSLGLLALLYFGGQVLRGFMRNIKRQKALNRV